MGITSRTGLLASPTKKITKSIQKPTLNLKATSIPAPFTVKPYAGLYNPYPYGCSLLCNHPADGEAKKMLKKAKDSWTNDGKPFLFPDEVAAIRAELQHLNMNENSRAHQQESDIPVDSVPEELFRRYTETDSRPLTPAPTLVSAHTRASAARRCVTPDPMYTSEIREKTLLVLDLRRSHSQETLSWYGTNQPTNEPPLIRVVHVGTRPESPSSAQLALEKRKSPRYLNAPGTKPRPKSGKPDTKTGPKSTLEVAISLDEKDEDDQQEGEQSSDEEFVKRRGRKRRKRGRDSSTGGSLFRASVDPETLVAAIGPDSQNASARPSLLPNTKELEEFQKLKLDNNRRMNSLEIDSFLDYETLRQLRRELTAEIVEFEFNLKRRKALQEALKTVPKIKIDCEELATIQREIDVPTIDTDLWLSLPRMFTRSSVRFELPMDSRAFTNMTPLQYLEDNVELTSTRKLLYNCVYNIFKTEYEEDVEKEREILGKKIPQALGVMMGGQLSEHQIDYMKSLVGWCDEQTYSFKLFCGICAICERLLAKDFYKNLPGKILDPCSEVETVDFESLERRLHNRSADERLVKLLRLIKES